MQKNQNRIETSCLIFCLFEWFGDPVVRKCTSLVLTIRSPYSAHWVQILRKPLE